MSEIERKITVLQVLPALDSGGVERGTVEITHALTQAGHKALVASQGGRMVQEVLDAGGEHITLPLKTKNPLTLWRNKMRLEKIIRDSKVDVVHARSRAPAWSAYLATRKRGVPFVTTFHAFYKLNFWGKRFYNSVMVRGDRVITISEFMRNHLRVEYHPPEDKMVLIYRGADSVAFNPKTITPERLATLRQSWALPVAEDVPLILCAGRLSRTKGQDVLIEALAELPPNTPFHCVFVGSEQGRKSVRNDLQKMVDDLGLTQKVSFVGDCRDMPAAYSLASIVVAPSLLPEAFGRVLVEAQAMERLMISSNLGAAPELIVPEQTGWLVEADNPAALAAALKDFFALSTNERRSRELKAAANVRDQFDTSIMCAKTLAVYEDLLGRG